MSRQAELDTTSQNLEHIKNVKLKSQFDVFYIVLKVSLKIQKRSASKLTHASFLSSLNLS